MRKITSAVTAVGQGSRSRDPVKSRDAATPAAFGDRDRETETGDGTGDGRRETGDGRREVNRGMELRPQRCPISHFHFPFPPVAPPSSRFPIPTSASATAEYSDDSEHRGRRRQGRAPVPRRRRALADVGSLALVERGERHGGGSGADARSVARSGSASDTTGPLASTQARSSTFCSSRMFPGQA